MNLGIMEGEKRCRCGDVVEVTVLSVDLAEFSVIQMLAGQVGWGKVL